MIRKTKPPTERFWAKVDKNGPVPAHCPELGQCWLWQGGTSLCGYGRFRRGRAVEGMTATHRWSLEQYLGRPILPDMQACHRCDTRLCVNPAHLFEGTQQDNETDKKNKGRTPRGDRHSSRTMPHRVPRGSRAGLAKLTESDIPVIRSRIAKGETQVTVAKTYSVTPTIISRILSRKIWKHVPL